MWIQQVNKDDPEKSWIAFTNGGAQTVTTHWPVFKFVSAKNASSVSTNEAGVSADTLASAGGVGSLIGLAIEDVAPGELGIAQCYGYHESFLVMPIVGSVTVAPGFAVGPGSGTASVGLSSTGDTFGQQGPVVALDTVGAALHSAAAPKYADHCFLRCA